MPLSILTLPFSAAEEAEMLKLYEQLGDDKYKTIARRMDPPRRKLEVQMHVEKL